MLIKRVSSVAAALAPRTEGGLDAKVKLVEYFSLTCPACAKFHTKVYPKIKQKYIDTGLIQMEYRDFPLDQWGLRAAALARCVGPKYYSAMIDVFTETTEHVDTVREYSKFSFEDRPVGWTK